ncbi:hypothetical protein O7626_31855 [Micromonospora sp. WMMD1102]|uniref:hypothetical protein n=1 Tax=Micromonospora sp. WMMD1102 TaxID=3016105 RepID=UPI002414F393|nr:hypothetical protein [Micromonospora sp. WMMD1102]MDG4790458.1 hypothetical protein [Micromonospora sp. WMMD1102]
MSEFQYYEFLAVDRQLSKREMAQVRSLSTRATITPTSFVNSYHWGNFKGDPQGLVEQYYDAFLYLANWGTRQLMLRLPISSLDLSTAEQYCWGGSASAWATGDHVVLDLCFENDGEEWDWEDSDGSGLLASIAPARAELASGEVRLLYLAWLLSVCRDDIDEGEFEPPVPPGLSELSGALDSLVDFLHIDRDLLAAAAEASQPLTERPESSAELASWLRQLPTTRKDALLLRVARGGASGVQAEVLRDFRAATSDEGPAAGTGATGHRTVAELWVAAEVRGAERILQAERAAAEEQVAREREAALARERRLDALAANGGERAWQQIAELISAKKTSGYDAAVAILEDLYALSERDGWTDEFARRLDALRSEHARKPSFVQRVDRALLPLG